MSMTKRALEKAQEAQVMTEEEKQAWVEWMERQAWEAEWQFREEVKEQS